MRASNKIKIRYSIIHNDYVNKDIKVLVLSDIHFSRLVGTTTINQIEKQLINQKPDYILIAGDLVDNPMYYLDKLEYSKVYDLLTRCGKIAKTLVILGNHDFIYEKVKPYQDVFDKVNVFNNFNKINNVHILIDENYEDDNIYVTGHMQKYETYENEFYHKDNNFFESDIKKLISNTPNNKFKILLTHSPEPIILHNLEELLKNYNIIVCGHNHDGCVPSFLDKIMPNNVGIIAPKKKLFPKVSRGIKKLKYNYLIMSGGWTKIHDCSTKIIHPLDKLCYRQIDIITITNNKKYKELEYKEDIINL